MGEKMKSVFCFVFISVMTFFLCGCILGAPESESAPASRLVTGIRVQFESGPIRVDRTFTTAEKIRPILHYLRIIDPYGPPEEDPETAEGSSFRIELQFSDGGRKVYWQKGERFMKAGDGSWKRINPKRARMLSQILGKMDADI